MKKSVPSLTTAQMIEVDRAMMEDYGIELIQMMENAGRCLADLTRRRFLDGDPRGRTVVVLAGRGGNGGGALVAARRMHNWGADVQVFLTSESEGFEGVPGHQLNILERMEVTIRGSGALKGQSEVAVILDGMIGYSLRGAPRGAAAEAIEWANRQSAPVLSLDVPSGLDATEGAGLEPVVRADATLTLALPKEGLYSRSVVEYVGELYLADISVPPALYESERIGASPGPLFWENDILRLA